MADLSDVQRDLLKSVYEQHWLHARHVENERLLVVNVYALLFAGMIAAYKDKFFAAETMPAHLLLMFLAVFCALFSIKIDAIFKGHTEKADSLVKAHGLPSPLTGLVATHWVNRWIRISRLFPSFFALCFCFLLGILLSNCQWFTYRYAPVLIGFALFVALLWLLDRLPYDKTPREYAEGSMPIKGAQRARRSQLRRLHRS